MRNISKAVRAIVLAAALIFGCCVAAQAAAPTIVQSTGCNVAALTCTVTLGSNVAAGNAIYVITAGWSQTGSPSFSQCTYNGSNMTQSFTTGVISAVVGVGLYAASVASVNSAICTYTNIFAIDAVIAEVNGATLIPSAWKSSTCNTSNCTTTISHNLLTSGSLALGAFNYAGAPSFDCGTSWVAEGTVGCSGTATNAANMSSQSHATFVGAWVAYADICPTGGCGGGGGGASPLYPKSNTYPGGMSLRGDPIFERLVSGWV